jgi:hypothetical protein
MDKKRIEAGFVTRAKVKWWGYGKYAHPYLWKTNPSDAEYQESWCDPRKAKEEKIEKKSELRQNIINEVKQNRGRKM